MMRVTHNEVEAFSREFSRQIDSGTSIVRALNDIAGRQSNFAFQQILAQISRNVQNGSTLSSAMSLHSGVFDAAYVGKIQQGENGDLAAALRLLY